MTEQILGPGSETDQLIRRLKKQNKNMKGKWIGEDIDRVEQEIKSEDKEIPKIVYDAILEVNKIDNIRLVYDDDNKTFKLYLSKEMIDSLCRDRIISIGDMKSKVNMMVRESVY